MKILSRSIFYVAAAWLLFVLLFTLFLYITQKPISWMHFVDTFVSRWFTLVAFLVVMLTGLIFSVPTSILKRKRSSVKYIWHDKF